MKSVSAQLSDLECIRILYVCRKIKTKVNTTANQGRGRYHEQPTRTENVWEKKMKEK